MEEHRTRHPFERHMGNFDDSVMQNRPEVRFLPRSHSFSRALCLGVLPSVPSHLTADESFLGHS